MLPSLECLPNPVNSLARIAQAVRDAVIGTQNPCPCGHSATGTQSRGKSGQVTTSTPPALRSPADSGLRLVRQPARPASDAGAAGCAPETRRCTGDQPEAPARLR